MQRHQNHAPSASDNDPSMAGAARIDGSLSAAERRDRDVRGFVRVGKSLNEDFIHGRLNFDEFGVLLLLWLRANPHNATVYITYQALSAESRGKFKTNNINKVFLALKRKRFVWFKKSSGSRGPIAVSINYFPLPKGGFTNTQKFLGPTGDWVKSVGEITEFVDNKSEVKEDVRAEVAPENSSYTQNFNDEITSLAERFSVDTDILPRRTAYKENNKENNKSPSFNEKPEYDPKNPIPKSEEEERARTIANALDEPNYVYITAKLKEYGIAVLEKAYAATLKKGSKGDVRDARAFFNAMVEQIGQGTYVD